MLAFKRMVSFIIPWVFFAQILTSTVFDSFGLGKVDAASGADVSSSVSEFVYGSGSITSERSISLSSDTISENVLYGDVNCDAAINSIDFALMRKRLLGLDLSNINTTNPEWDVDGNGLFNSIDFAYMTSQGYTKTSISIYADVAWSVA
jgi:hypothetical protein